jgi:hypothetical protein
MVNAVVTGAYVPKEPTETPGSAVRSQPGSSASIAIVGRLHAGDTIRISEGYVTANGYRWHQVEKIINGQVVFSGWIADTSAFAWRVEPPAPPPDEPPAPPDDTHPPDNPPDEDSDHDTHPNLPPTPELHPDSMSTETREALYIVCDFMARQWAALAEQVKP